MPDQGETRPAKPKRPHGYVSGWLVAVLLVLVFALFWKQSGGLPPSLFNTRATRRFVTVRGDLAAMERSQISVFEEASPSVVHVRSSVIISGRLNLNPFDESRSGAGSGVIWDEDGNIVTSHHVVREADRFIVTLPDSSVYDAVVIGEDPDNDLAVLKIVEPTGTLVPIPIGTSHDLKVGQSAYAIGHPFSLGLMYTAGVISAVGQVIKTPEGETINDVIQTDAAVAPGYSGGPLLDSAGRLIGINTAIASTTNAHARIGFAVPVDTVNEVVPRLIRGMKDEAPVLGITLAPDAFVEGLRARGVIKNSGVIVRDVLLNSVLTAGIRPTEQLPDGTIILGDLIVAVDGEVVESGRDMRRILERREIGEPVTVTVRRNGETSNIRLTLRKRRRSDE